MDTGDYDTNTLLINNITAIGFRFFELLSDQHSSISSILLDVEIIAKNDGHLVFADYVRRGLWTFSLPSTPPPAQTSPAPWVFIQGDMFDIYGQTFAIREEGSYEGSTLLKSRIHGPNSAATPNSSSSTGSLLGTTQQYGISPQSATQNPSDIHFAGIDTRLHGSPINDVHEYFLSALLSGLTSAFARCTGAIPLNSRSLALPQKLIPSESSDSSLPSNTIATLRAYITTTGALVISLSIQTLSGILPLRNSPYTNPAVQTPPLLLAPAGLFGNLARGRDLDSPLDGGMVIQSPDTHMVRIRNPPPDKVAIWHLAWTKVLDHLGVSSSLIDNTEWVSIQFVRPRPVDPIVDAAKRNPASASATHTILWPSVFCFAKNPGGSSPSPMSRTDDTISSGRVDSYDPLSAAKAWFSAARDRDAVISQRKRERDMATAPRDRDAIPETGDLKPKRPAVYSPLILKRTAMTRPDPAVVSAMYPTPPDAVQNPANGVTPSFDGVLSSSPNGLNTTAVVDRDAVMSGQTASSKDAVGDAWLDHDERKSRAQSLFGAEPENLFGDIGDDIFGDEGVTDADFNFFDNDDLDLGALDDIGAVPMSRANITANGSGPKPQSLSMKPPAVPTQQFVFVKPELKSVRGGVVARPDAANPGNRIVPIKRQPSPFNAMTVYKRVHTSTRVAKPTRKPSPRSRHRKVSVFQKLDFTPFLSSVSDKYKKDERFQCPTKPVELQVRSSSDATASEYLKRHGKGRQRLKRLPFSASNGPKMIEPPNSKTNPDEEVISDADDSSASELDECSPPTSRPTSPVKSIAASRLPEDDGLSIATSFRELDGGLGVGVGVGVGVDDGPSITSPDLAHYSRSCNSDLSLVRYFADNEPFPIQVVFDNQDLITIAQILTDQAATGNLQFVSPPEPSPRTIGDKRRELAVMTRQSVNVLHSIVSSQIGEAIHCQLRSLIEVPDVPLLGQPTRQPRPNAREDHLKPSHLFPIPPPHLQLRRHLSKLSVLPSAVFFWESLGLAPSLGSKDLSSVCVFPAWEGMIDNAHNFLDRIRASYESLKLGSFQRVIFPQQHETQQQTPSDHHDGILPFEVDKISTSNDSGVPFSPALSEQMAKLANAMAGSTVEARNFVVFFVYSRENPRSIIESCAAFQALFGMYKTALSSRGVVSPVNELVLQLIPLEAVASPTSIAIPPPGETLKLALEVYDRCTLFGGPMPAPSILLEKPTPRGVDFKLTTSPSCSLLNENQSIHVAYAESVDGRWVTAAWTDTRGQQQLTASYCLGRRGQQLGTRLEEVQSEIWGTTLDIVRGMRVHWRIMIAKVGGMGEREVGAWVELGAVYRNSGQAGGQGGGQGQGLGGTGGGGGGSGNWGGSLTLTLLTVDTKPSLQLLPKVVQVPSEGVTGSLATPATTPQPGGTSTVLSPDTHPTDPTPTTPSEIDSKSRLIDYADQSWGCILNHRLNTSSSLVTFQPALISGYLFKRGGRGADDAPVGIEVNILHSDANARLYEALMRECLGAFRGLGSLSRARGVTGIGDCRPWHVAVCEKGVGVLYGLM